MNLLLDRGFQEQYIQMFPAISEDGVATIDNVTGWENCILWCILFFSKYVIKQLIVVVGKIHSFIIKGPILDEWFW